MLAKDLMYVPAAWGSVLARQARPGPAWGGGHEWSLPPPLLAPGPARGGSWGPDPQYLPAMIRPNLNIYNDTAAVRRPWGTGAEAVFAE